MKGASRGLEGGLRRASRGLQRRASRGLEKGFKGASRGLQALLTFVPPPLGGTLQAPLEGYLRRWWLGSRPCFVWFAVVSFCCFGLALFSVISMVMASLDCVLVLLQHGLLWPIFSPRWMNSNATINATCCMQI